MTRALWEEDFSLCNATGSRSLQAALRGSLKDVLASENVPPLICAKLDRIVLIREGESPSTGARLPVASQVAAPRTGLFALQICQAVGMHIS